MNIYIASSWRNNNYKKVVHQLRRDGHEVYDFSENGFAWEEIDEKWKDWTLYDYLKALDHQRAIDGFQQDLEALKNADAVVLVTPCGKSAHLELGYAIGAGKLSIILLNTEPAPFNLEYRPELMYKMADYLAIDYDELLDMLEWGGKTKLIK